MSALPLVLVPGLGCDRRLWQPVLDRLGDLIVPTVMECVGDSIEDMADEVLSRAPESFYLAGISMGGYVALDAALRGTDRIAGLALLNTSARAASPEQTRRASGHIDDARDGRFDAVVETIIPAVSGANPEVAAVAEAMLRAKGPDGFVRQHRAVLERRDRRAELPTILMPTLVIGAELDPVTPPDLSDELADLIPHAEGNILTNCGHLATLSATAEVAESMRRWLVAGEQDAKAATEGVQAGRALQ